MFSQVKKKFWQESILFSKKLLCDKKVIKNVNPSMMSKIVEFDILNSFSSDVIIRNNLLTP